MSRPLRIQYADAWYHVMNRGRRGEKIFEAKADYWSFIDLLEELNEVFNVKVAAYWFRGRPLLITLRSFHASVMAFK
jgi:putative transposase